MIVVKLLYLVLVIGLAVFSVLYIDSLPIVLLLCVLMVPPFLLLSLLWGRLTCRGELLCGTPVTSAGDTVPLTLSLVSRCPLPFPQVHAVAEIRHAFGAAPEVLHLRFPLRGRNTTRMTFYIHSDCCGTVDVTIRKLYMLDYLRMFSVKLPIQCRAQHITVMPKRIPLTLEDAAPPAYCEESEIYADAAGDDPAEISGLREYIPGDAVSRIHWKLSSKLDRTMIREFGMPVRKSVLLAVDYSDGEKRRTLDTMRRAEAVLSILYSAACRLLEMGIDFEILWHSADSGVLRRQPANAQELAQVFCTMFLSAADMTLEPSALHSTEHAYSSVICVSNSPSEALLRVLEQEMEVSASTLVCVTDQPAVFPEQGRRTDVQNVRPGCISEDLSVLIV